MSPPYMPFYVADYLADTGHLSAAENGAYLLLIMHYWRTGGLPPDDEMRRRVSRMTHREWQRSRTTVLGFFSIDGKHKRIDEVLSAATHRSDVQRDKALKYQEALRATALPRESHSSHISESSKKDKDRDADASLPNETVGTIAIEIERPEKKALREGLQSFGEQWNELAASLRLPAIDEIKPGSTRERWALARLREMPPEGVRDLMARIRGSPYLRGEVNGFRCTFDWITNSSNFQKIMEGNYEDRKISALRR